VTQHLTSLSDFLSFAFFLQTQQYGKYMSS